MKTKSAWTLKDAFCRQVSETDFELGNRFFLRKISLKDGCFRTTVLCGEDSLRLCGKNPRELDLSFYGDRCSFQEMKYASGFAAAVVRKATELEPEHLEVTFCIREDRQKMTILRTFFLYPGFPALSMRNRIRMEVEPNVFWNTRPGLRREYEGHFPPGVFPEGCVDCMRLADHFHPEACIAFHARTDFCDEQVEHHHAAGRFLNGNLLTFADGNGHGMTWLQEAPCSEDRRDLTDYDFRRDGKMFFSCGWGVFPGEMRPGKWYCSYRTTLLTHPEGDSEKAVRSYLRFRTGTARDLAVVVNPWGCGKFAQRLSADFLLEELKAAGECGSELYQIDDGWQDGGTLSDLSGKNTRIEAETFWKIAPCFWNGDFSVPRDFAKAHGVELALWCAPTNNIAYADWRKFAALLLDFHRKYGISVFKLDGVTLRSSVSEENFESMLRLLNRKSQGKIRFNFDVTYGQRGGYFRFLEYGSIFLENRYLCHPHGLGYHPERTLRNLWRLAHWIPAQKLQLEVPWPGDINRDFYRKKGESFPDEYPWDYWLAIPMAAAPLLWFAPSSLPDADRAMCRKMMGVYRQLRPLLSDADVLPVGEVPTGHSITGFFIRSGISGFLILFREKNCKDTVAELSLPGMPFRTEWKRISGDARITVSDGRITIRWKASPSFAIYTWRSI